MPLSVVADDCERDNVTGHALVRGLGLDVNDLSFSVSKGPFSHGFGLPGCAEFTNDEIRAAIASQMKKYPSASSFQAIGADMMAMAGLGAAGSWAVSDCK